MKDAQDMADTLPKGLPNGHIAAVTVGAPRAAAASAAASSRGRVAQEADDPWTSLGSRHDGMSLVPHVPPALVPDTRRSSSRVGSAVDGADGVVSRPDNMMGHLAAQGTAAGSTSSPAVGMNNTARGTGSGADDRVAGGVRITLAGSASNLAGITGDVPGSGNSSPAASSEGNGGFRSEGEGDGGPLVRRRPTAVRAPSLFGTCIGIRTAHNGAGSSSRSSNSSSSGGSAVCGNGAIGRPAQVYMPALTQFGAVESPLGGGTSSTGNGGRSSGASGGGDGSSQGWRIGPAGNGVVLNGAARGQEATRAAGTVSGQGARAVRDASPTYRGLKVGEWVDEKESFCSVPTSPVPSSPDAGAARRSDHSGASASGSSGGSTCSSASGGGKCVFGDSSGSIGGSGSGGSSSSASFMSRAGGVSLVACMAAAEDQRAASLRKTPSSSSTGGGPGMGVAPALTSSPLSSASSSSVSLSPSALMSSGGAGASAIVGGVGGGGGGVGGAGGKLTRKNLAELLRDHQMKRRWDWAFLLRRIAAVLLMAASFLRRAWAGQGGVAKSRAYGGGVVGVGFGSGFGSNQNKVRVSVVARALMWAALIGTSARLVSLRFLHSLVMRYVLSLVLAACAVRLVVLPLIQHLPLMWQPRRRPHASMLPL